MFSSLIPQPLSVHLGKMEPVSDQDRSLLNSQIGITGPLSTNPASHGVQKVGEIGPMQSNAGLQIPLLPTKRKAAAESSVLNKHQAPLNSTRLSQQSVLPNKRMMLNESMSNRVVSPRVQTPKSKAAPPEVSPKAQHGSYQAVRMKMRETLAAALSVGNQDKDIVPNVDKSTIQESGNTAGEVVVLGSTTVDAAPVMASEEKPQFSYVMPDMDDTFGNSFFPKDDLLQGNGLSWDWDMEVAKLTEAQTNESMNFDEKNLSGNGIGQMLCSPQELAVKVESELYKLFGGVNKKYKEKGRSLMFNLKDPNNPKLREKVLSSEITPERLCSMTPEELASKELSEWRMAKAEEFDKMIVLPDSDIDMRRLVRKTHKGEFQVEVDQVDDGASVEVSVGSSSLTRVLEKTKTDRLSSSGDVVREKMVDSSNLTISTDVTDFMQEIIVNEFKDEGSLPTIVSLDEFMESLDSEPPFEDLPEDGKETHVQPDKDYSKTGGEGNEKASSGTTSVNSTEAETITNDDKSNIKITEALSSVRTSETSAEPFGGSIDISLWEGDLQLTLSSSVPVIGVFKSGEKTSTKEWPGSVEIKGRVRLTAFEKFLQELPMSRTREVMVVHFVLKDASSLVHQASLSEVMASYLADERVGFGEPNPGVEVYFCPPHKRTTETLSRLLSKDQTDVIESPQLGLIGVVVWRRAHSSAILPNSHSQHKHHRKHLSSRRQDNINANTNSNMITKSLSLLPQSNNGVDDGDDVPPGFGPGVVNQDEDDLPEFSFSKGSNSSWQTLPAQSSMVSTVPPTRPVGHMRHLVYQYGQANNITALASITQTGTESRHWNQDDDIPEWNPQIQKGHGQVPNHMHLANQVRPTGHDMTPFMPIPQSINLMQNSNGQMPIPHGLPPNAFVPGQYYGGQWRQGY
uniref:uncharacterized protein LOC122608332 n=1 Tax=Erigeron canadensis TaxID=72917 RepID=UPI001CB8B1AA|nr:uncharacterized protein LOC122608332 [Erigeron canadensis]